MKSKIILSVILTGLALIFMIQNFSVINIRLLFWSFSISGSLLMFSLFLTGFILGWVIHSYSIHSRRNVKD
ncbi:MAG: LapA family protein [Calditrichaceae bacterium]|nr:LapA family protein [Calditrichaceae bacterium]MBN2709720.1 LapA family protein [Calditrichaceae bacterium]RQV92535.1 MAG: LapA family protein [Calditrichota bacterium]